MGENLTKNLGEDKKRGSTILSQRLFSFVKTICGPHKLKMAAKLYR